MSIRVKHGTNVPLLQGAAVAGQGEYGKYLNQLAQRDAEIQYRREQMQMQADEAERDRALRGALAEFQAQKQFELADMQAELEGKRWEAQDTREAARLKAQAELEGKRWEAQGTREDARWKSQADREDARWKAAEEREKARQEAEFDRANYQMGYTPAQEKALAQLQAQQDAITSDSTISDEDASGMLADIENKRSKIQPGRIPKRGQPPKPIYSDDKRLYWNSQRWEPVPDTEGKAGAKEQAEYDKTYRQILLEQLKSNADATTGNPKKPEAEVVRRAREITDLMFGRTEEAAARERSFADPAFGPEVPLAPPAPPMPGGRAFAAPANAGPAVLPPPPIEGAVGATAPPPMPAELPPQAAAPAQRPAGTPQVLPLAALVQAGAKAGWTPDMVEAAQIAIAQAVNQGFKQGAPPSAAQLREIAVDAAMTARRE